MNITEPRTLIMEDGVIPADRGSLHPCLPCLQVFSGFQATVIKFTYEASLVSLLDLI